MRWCSRERILRFREFGRIDRGVEGTVACSVVAGPPRRLSQHAESLGALGVAIVAGVVLSVQGEEGRARGKLMDVDIEKITIECAWRMLIAWQWAFGAYELAQWIRNHTPVHVTVEQVEKWMREHS